VDKTYLYKIIANPLLLKTVKLSAVTLFANFIGFLVPIYIAYNYAISQETDKFFLSYSFVLFVGTMFSQSVRSVSIPFLRERLGNRGSFEIFISSVLLFFVKFLGILCIMLFLGTYSALKITQNDLFWYFFLTVPIVFFSIINAFFYGVLNSLDQFYLAEMTPFSRAIVIFISIYFFSDSLGIIAIIVGYNLREIVKTVHLSYVVLKRNNLNINLRIVNNEEISSFVKQGSYQVVSSTITAATPMIDRIIASFLVAGSVSILDYGDKVFTIFMVLLNSFLVLLLSRWSNEFIKGKISISSINKILLFIFVVCVVLSIIIFNTDNLIIDFLYPKVNIGQREIIASVLTISTIGFIFNAMSQTINRATIAMKGTDILIKTSVVKVVTNVVLDLIFIKYWGILGIAYATIVVHIIGLCTNYYLFYKKVVIK
jgi:putative peptidoglycan lipid II flippase